jgi:hypothetical protein
MSAIKQKRGWILPVVGTQQGGWSVAGRGVMGAIRELAFNVQIESDPGGYLLVYASQDGALFGDTWHETLAEAEEVALEEFGIPPSGWDPADDAG